jgi:hypothetical protein
MTDERGQLGGLEGLAFGVLVFVIGTLVIANAWAVVDAKLAASSAAREAARAYVESSADDADAAASAAATDAIRGYGRDPERMTVGHDEGVFARCRRITFAVEYRLSLGSVPLLNRAAMTFVAAARHSELVDPYRTGVPGEASCVTD